MLKNKLDTLSENFFKVITGKWILTKQVQGSMNAYMKGIAEFIYDDNNKTLIQTEKGKITIDKKTVDTRASYKYIQKEKNILVYFNSQAKTSFFHEMIFESPKHFDKTFLKANGKHLCGQDTYLTTYVLHNNKMTITHTVKGPQKDYVIFSSYTPSHN